MWRRAELWRETSSTNDIHSITTIYHCKVKQQWAMANIAWSFRSISFVHGILIQYITSNLTGTPLRAFHSIHSGHTKLQTHKISPKPPNRQRHLVKEYAANTKQLGQSTELDLVSNGQQGKATPPKERGDIGIKKIVTRTGPAECRK